jgi:hypothetical protein
MNRSRLANRVQLSSDGHKPYLSAVEEAFGDEDARNGIPDVIRARPEIEIKEAAS